MSFQGLRGFRDFETSEIKNELIVEADKASSGVMDSHWDLIMVNYCMKNIKSKYQFLAGHTTIDVIFAQHLIFTIR